jgi:hypothetical protein
LLGDRTLTAATGFFFRAADRLYLATSRHVFHDDASDHLPDRIEFTVHTSSVALAQVVRCRIPLYRDGLALWVQGRDGGGPVDVAAIELAADVLPAEAQIRSFSAANLELRGQEVGVGAPVLLPGFPLGFYDTRHYLPVVRRGSIASAFGVRFQGEGYFLTDARMHRGSSGTPVVIRCPGAPGLEWTLLGVHSARMDMSTRDLGQDDVLGLNCAWYADILETLTHEAAQSGRSAAAVRETQA